MKFGLKEMRWNVNNEIDNVTDIKAKLLIQKIQMLSSYI